MSARSQTRPLSNADNGKSKQDVNFGPKPGKPLGSAQGGNGGGGGGGAISGNGGQLSVNADCNPRRGPPPAGRGERGGRWGRGGYGDHRGNKQPPQSYGRESASHGRGRGGGGSGHQRRGTGHQRRGPVTEIDEFEVGKSGKKQNISHLMNFQYEPRGQGGIGGRGGSGNNRSRIKNHRGKSYIARPSYSKEQHLHATCQFVVVATSSGVAGDTLAPYRADPDLVVSWEMVEQVHLISQGGSSDNKAVRCGSRRAEPLSCPICLFPPTAGKISRCGHVFCWPCILHYLALSDDDWRKCPICYENVQKSDLKSVKIFQQETRATGCSITMRLMKRERTSLLATPAQHAGLADFPTIHDPAGDQALSKIIKATPDAIIASVLMREKQELDELYAAEKDQPEVVFIQEALTLLEDRKNQCMELSLLIGPVLPRSSPLECKSNTIAAPIRQEHPCRAKGDGIVTVADPFEDTSESRDDGKQDDATEEVSIDANTTTDVTSDAVEVVDGIPALNDAVDCYNEACGGLVDSLGQDLSNLSLQPQSNGNKALQAPKTTFYFYQDCEGQLIYLHALNVQMLLHQFGCFENCPESISGKILEKDSFVMSVELRDRLRYLRHLPVTSSFEVAELDISGLFSAETINHFQDQLEARRKERQRKQKAEKIREKKIKRDEMRIMGRFPSPMARIDSAYHYPSMNEEAAVIDGFDTASHSNSSNSSWPTAATAATNVSSDGVEAVPGGSNSSDASSGGLNFARIAKRQAAPAVVAAPTATATASKFGGMVQLGGALPMARVRQPSESEPEPEGYVPPPPVASLGDALAQAIARADNKQGTKKKGKRSRGQPISLTSGGAGVPVQQR